MMSVPEGRNEARPKAPPMHIGGASQTDPDAHRGSVPTDPSVGVIVGSAFEPALLEGMALQPETIETHRGPWTLYRVDAGGRPAYVSFRHGYPHRLLPHQIPYRAQAAAFSRVGCGALLVTSSVGVLDPALPLFEPLLVDDLITLENRLPDGSACTMFTDPSPGHGHLVVSEGLFSPALNAQLAVMLGDEALAGRGVVFGYVGGPRTKTRAENRMWRQLGAQVNSMTLAPEVILAAELGIACCAVVVGHKYSVPAIEEPLDERSVAQSLIDSRAALGRLVRSFLMEARPVASGNHLYRYAETGPSS